MPVYKKTVRVGQFAKKNEDYKDGDRVIILNEGVKTEGTFGSQDVFSVRVPNGAERSMSFNKTSINNMIDAFGEDSAGWVGKEVKVWLILQNVQGKMVRVTYLSHPDADVDEEGNFVIDGAQKEGAPEAVQLEEGDIV